ncbi:hypothetical protein EON63_02025 [archaeon]|nr:MAG: hypothetical protein EON63_02025 [archaeon]
MQTLHIHAIKCIHIHFTQISNFAYKTYTNPTRKGQVSVLCASVAAKAAKSMFCQAVGSAVNFSVLAAVAVRDK